MAKTAKATEAKAKEAGPKGRAGSPERDGQAQNPPSASPQGDTSQAGSKKQVQSVEFPDAVDTETTASDGKYDILLDMNVPVTVCLGQTEITVRRLLQLGPGSVLKLNKSIDAPADLFLKDARFAIGDVVVVDEQFAIRIKQIIGTEVDSEVDQTQ
jgi:flagellar motor switch protein FliN/FliY